MSDSAKEELRALLALCRGTAGAYRRLPEATPDRVAAIVDGLGDRIEALLARVSP